MQTSRRLEVNVEELDRLIDKAEQEPLSKADCRTLKSILHALVERLDRRRNTEKSSVLLKHRTPSVIPEAPPQAPESTPAGHGRNAASTFTGAVRVSVPHSVLRSGDTCPECSMGRVYRQKEPKTLIRITGTAPLHSTVFEMERLRCNGCGQVFTAEEPRSAGPEKYDVTAVAMIALLKYGTGMPFHRMERLEGQLGIPLPASTQWELVERAASLIGPVLDELIRQAAQGSVLHNDDTSMRILRLARNSDDSRTGTFTSGIVSIWQEWKIALYFTGWKHAGENLGDVLKRRASELEPPVQMCDALSRNTPKLSGVEILLANCIAHGRRQFIDIITSFPDECRYVLESVGKVYDYDAQAREQRLAPEQRLLFHQQQSGPVMDTLHRWLRSQLDEHRTESNSGLGKAITYLLRHWTKLTLFLRQPGAPIDNNLVERSLKRAILHRKNALFYKSIKGAHVGDLFMSLIHTCELNGVNPFDYLTELLRHHTELAMHPEDWLPWKYGKTLARLLPSAA